MKKVKTDVLVVGYGFAGAIAGIVAHDAGATVLISEKMAQFGGCSMLSGGGVTFVQDPEGGFEYFKELCGGRTPASALKGTVNRWNHFVREGKDADFGRPKETMSGPIEAAPFYAMEAWPTITNTQGGPEHDEHQRILSYKGKPVPRLYAAGELGSMFGHLYELGGNIGEAITSGSIAGWNAAKEETLP